MRTLALLVLVTSCAAARQGAEDVAAFGIDLRPSPVERLQARGVEASCAYGSIAWIVPVEGGVVLVDAGFDESGAVITRALRGRRVLAVLLTHGHPDHTAAAHVFDAPVYVGRGDIPLLEGTHAHRHLSITLAGALLAAPKPHTVVPVDGGSIVVVGGRSFRAVAVPGHTPGSTAWLSERALFTGDAALAPLGVLAPSPSPFSDDIVRAWASLRRLSLLDVDMILDGHFGRTSIERATFTRSFGLEQADVDDDVPWGCPTSR